jgi:hypothetical protein
VQSEKNRIIFCHKIILQICLPKGFFFFFFFSLGGMGKGVVCLFLSGGGKMGQGLSKYVKIIKDISLVFLKGKQKVIKFDAIRVQDQFGIIL